MENIFVFDIGNTFVKIFSFNQPNSRIESYTHTNFLEWVENKCFDNCKLLLGISVVPTLDRKLKNLLGDRIVFLDLSHLKLIDLKEVGDKSQLGIDRVVALNEVYDRYRQSCCVVASGTATTLTIINSEGVYKGGVILPGLQMTLHALNDYTEKIPLISFETVDTLLAHTTKGAVLSGLFYGFSHMINALLEDIKKHYPDIKIIGCGQGLNYIKDNLNLESYEPQLVIDGLRSIARNYLN